MKKLFLLIMASVLFVFSLQVSVAQAAGTTQEETRELKPSEDDAVILGVCSGIAEYVDVDPTVIRVIFVMLSLAYGFGIGAYLLIYLIMVL